MRRKNKIVNYVTWTGIVIAAFLYVFILNTEQINPAIALKSEQKESVEQTGVAEPEAVKLTAKSKNWDAFYTGAIGPESKQYEIMFDYKGKEFSDIEAVSYEGALPYGGESKGEGRSLEGSRFLIAGKCQGCLVDRNFGEAKFTIEWNGKREVLIFKEPE
ncbi:hypothetical protein [Pseudalkalibacillus caeni]|uniref:Uncharacterized protein n=1 Tax=Exobacillus caeni TaxID=2574798 RepID=A0A5R9EY89_9BACL|nr:hypothetical protein [Pseudalkalibacillus caeni]TLS36097.1 hypothetical protein FCL54_17070 [Pseudalkalibacillus caeni]